ncbi:dUTP diphosphatase [Bacteroidia bacterium]|nr:dUTP diphosphatase [Bacteroidia bacterium]
MNVKVKNTSNNPLPKYQTRGSAGMDLYAHLSEPISLKAGTQDLISTGLHLELPQGFEAQIRPRSGLALKHGISIVNSPGTIDSDYRGEIKVVLINHGKEILVINNGDRIAQMVIAKFEQIAWDETDHLEETERGAGGYGHTGKK